MSGERLPFDLRSSGVFLGLEAARESGQSWWVVDRARLDVSMLTDMPLVAVSGSRRLGRIGAVEPYVALGLATEVREPDLSTLLLGVGGRVALGATSFFAEIRALEGGFARGDVSLSVGVSR